jgi:hypothetical protein
VDFALGYFRARPETLGGMPSILPDCFGMYDLQINWGNGRLSCTGRVLYEPREGAEVVWTEGHPFDGVPVLRLLQQTVEEFDNSSEGVLGLQFSNGDRLTVARENGPEAFTIHHSGKPIIVG